MIYANYLLGAANGNILQQFQRQYYSGLGGITTQAFNLITDHQRRRNAKYKHILLDGTSETPPTHRMRAGTLCMHAIFSFSFMILQAFYHLKIHLCAYCSDEYQFDQKRDSYAACDCVSR